MQFAFGRSSVLRSFLAVSLAAVFVLSAGAQQDDALRIVMVQGENARHNIRTHAASPTVVEVRDTGNRPLTGARVEFELPALGPGGHFADGGRRLTVVTDSQGRATMFGFVPNDQEGEFRIVVSASENGRSTSLGVVQHNVLFSAGGPPAQAARPTHSTAGTKLLLLVVIGAAVAAGAIAASKAGSSGSSAAAASVPTATPSIGTITVGGAH